MGDTKECFKNISALETNESALEDILFEKIVNYNDKDDCLQCDQIANLIGQLYNEGKISRDILYLSVLSNTDNFLINELIKYEKSVVKILDYPGSLYDFVVCENRQWFEISIENSDLSNMFDQHILNIVNILKLVYYTNKHLKPNAEEWKANFQELNEFWKTYYTKIKFIWDVIDYCTSVELIKNLDEVFVYSSQNACIKILVNFLKCEQFKYEEVLHILQKEDKAYNSMKQVDNILAYSICMTIFNSIQDVSSVSNIRILITKLKEKLLSISNKKMIVELLENIFTILFITTNNFTNRQVEFNTFICQEPEMRLVLFILKELLDETKAKGLFNVNSSEYADFLSIQKYVTNALWRMELISKVKSPQKCERKLLKYMLAMPESLIQMCLKEGDYERAYQVVQVRHFLTILYKCYVVNISTFEFF